MKIDRSSFLVLATAIAAGGAIAANASGCIVSNNDDDDADGGSAGVTNTGGDAQGGTGGTAQGGSGGTAQGGGGSGGGTCDDSIGTPGDCSNAPSSVVECAESAFQGAAEMCGVARDYFKPAVGEAAVDCIESLNDTGAGGGTPATCQAVLDCRNDALNNACDDSDADALCTTLQTACIGLTDAECHDLVDGMDAVGRAAVETQCGPTMEGACDLGLQSCVDMLY